MNWVSIMFSASSIFCSIIAALVVSGIMPPMSEVDLTFGLLIVMALMFVSMAADSRRNEEDGNQDED